MQRKKIFCVFELSGGMITHMLDSIGQRTQIRIVTMHHEQSAAFAADAFGRMTGLPGIALATSGPGATNLLTGIGSCYFDSSPAIFITGQVNRHEQKGQRNIRQLGFQETDIISMARPITKAAYQVSDPADIPKILAEAFFIATEGRPGPVLIDIPMDVQRAQIEEQFLEEATDYVCHPEEQAIYEMIADLKKAKRPLILAGGGITASRAHSLFAKLVDRLNIPVITTLLGLDAIPYQDPLRVGFIGSYGNRWANIAFGECDLLLVMGSRLDIRQTGADTKFVENRKIYHIDCEAGEINNRVKGCMPVLCNLKNFIENIITMTDGQSFELPRGWLDRIADLKAQWPDIKELSPDGINPNIFMHLLSAASAGAAAYVVDVGSHQMWSAQSLELRKGQKFLTSGGMGAMGFSLPASIGASLASSSAPVLMIAGDGCMQLNIQELQTVVRNKLPLKIIVMNNRTLGMIRQFQDSYFESRYQSTYWGYDAPDFEKVAVAYGLAAKTIDSENEMQLAVEWLWNEENKDRPVLLQVMIDPHTNTYPKIAFGKPLTEMEPFSKPVDMEGT